MLISYCILILVYPNYIILKILCLLTKVTSIKNKTKTGTMNKQQDFNPKNYDIYIDMKTPTHSVMLKNKKVKAITWMALTFLLKNIELLYLPELFIPTLILTHQHA